MKKFTLLLLVALLALVAACGPSATPTTAPAQPTTAPVAPTTAPAPPPTAAATTAAVVPAPTAAGPAIVENGTMIEGSFADARTLNSILSSDTSSGRILTLLGNGLIQVKPDLLPECDLCESWTVSPDNLKVTFKLKKGVKFHDGTEMTADDVKFTYDSILDPDKASPRRGGLKDFFTSGDSIKVIDASTIEFNYAKVKADTLVSDYLYQVLPKKVLGAMTAKDFLAADFNTKTPVYTGPFMFKEWVKDDHLTVVANPNYFKGKPKLGTYIYKIVPDSTALFAQLKTGEIDLGTLDKAQLADAKKLTNITTYAYDQFNFTFFAFNLDAKKTTLFQDKKVRQALTFALDRKAIVESQLFGLGVVANTSMPIPSWAYNANNSPVYPYDPAKAKALLDEAGWKVGADGIRAKDGKKMQFTVWTNAGNKVREQSIVAMQSNWKDIGVSVETKTEEWNAYLKRIGATPDGTYDYEVFLVGFNWGVDPGQQDMWLSTGGFNLNKYSNPEMDKVLNDALATLDQAKRKDLYFKMQSIVADEVPSVILFFEQATGGYNKRINGFKPTAAGTFNDRHLWWAGPKTQ